MPGLNNPNYILTAEQRIAQAALGVHRPLILVEAPAAHVADLGKPLNGLVLATNGDYYCAIDLRGLASAIKVQLRATLATKTATTEGPDLVALFDPRFVDASTAFATVLVAGTGDGALTHVTRQASTVPMTGEAWAIVKIVVGGGAGSVTVTLAEYTGL